MKAAPILFVGEGWLGSSARSFREALVRQDVAVHDWNEDSVFPHWRTLPLRMVLRASELLIRASAKTDLIGQLDTQKPQVLLVYKGSSVDAEILEAARRRGIRAVNMFPDSNPFIYGPRLARALSVYDLVLSTKAWHPAAWHQVFGLPNRCEFLPHGYDPILHRPRPEWRVPQDLDVVLVATYRAEYGRLIEGLAAEPGIGSLVLGIFGAGWPALPGLPSGWTIGGPVHGHAYTRTILRARAVIAPVMRDVVYRGTRYPGDEDSIRTYELPAIGVPMVHRRTDYIQSIFREGEEILLYDTPAELGAHLQRLMKSAIARHELAESARARVVGRDSLDMRAQRLISILEAEGWL